MSRGTAEEDDDVPIEITPEIIEGSLDSGPASLSQESLPEAAVSDPRVDLAFYLEEIESAGAAGAGAGAAVAPLFHQVAHLQESALGDADAALVSYRQAQARDPAFAATLGPLRRIFTARGVPTELGALFEQALRVAPLARRDRAEMAVERGRILEDQLGRAGDAAASYRAALAEDARHPGALIALLLLAARTGDGAGIGKALAGLAEAARNPDRRAALSVELARLQRQVDGPLARLPANAAAGDSAERAEGGDPEQALATVRAALAAAGPTAPPRALLQELGELTRLGGSPRIQTDALDELMRHLPVGAVALEAALRREKAHLLRNVIRDPAAAFAELAAARRLMPRHRLVTSEMVDIADETGRIDLVAGLVSELGGEGDAGAAGAATTAMVLSRFVEALARSGRAAEALALLREQGGAAPADAAAFAVRIALLAETGDAAGLADAFEEEGDSQGESAASTSAAAAAHALVRAATLREIVLQDGPRAEALYRRALARLPGYTPAVDALEEKLRADARWGDLAQLLEGDLAGPPVPPPARQRYILQTLVALHKDRVGDLPTALEAQRRLAALDPDDVRAWVGLADLQLSVALDADDDAAELRRQHAATLLELSKRAGAPSVAAALKAEAARLSAGDTGADGRDEAERLYREASPDDPSGLAAGGLESLLADPAARLDAVSSELATAAARGSGADPARARDRALRYRMAFEHVAARSWKPALASLRPLREAGDTLALAWSHDLARRSGDAKLLVSLLREHEERTALAGEATPVMARAAAADLGEALEREGDLTAAQAAFRAALGEPGAGQKGDGDGAAKDMDAALGLYRTSAATQPAADFDGMVEALRTIGTLSANDPAIEAAAFREADLVDAARGLPIPATPPFVPPSAGGEPTLDGALLRWMAGLRAGDQRQVSEALMALASRLAAGGEGRSSPAAVSLALRASARSRLAGAATAQALHRSAWAIAPRNATLAHALSDLHARGGAAAGMPETRAGRAGRLLATGTAAELATALDLERALDLEAGGDLGDALGAYGRILALDGDHLEAMEGVRRVARAGGDEAGEARAAARLGALTRVPGRAATLYSDAALLFEKAGRDEDAIALYLKVLEVAPDDEAAFRSLLELLHAAPDAPGNAKTLDRLLSHRLQRRRGIAVDAELTDLYTQRADNRLHRLEDPAGATQDFKRILKIDARDENALRQLATLAIEMRYPVDAARLLERYLDVTTDSQRAAAARLELAEAYETAQDPASAIRVLQSAVAARPGDAVALGRLADVSLRAGDWRGAVEALRALEEIVLAPYAKAELYMRIGALLRDEGYDLPAAAVAFRHAADLDPLGDGTGELARLHESAGDGLGRQQVIEEAIVEARRALDRDPLDVARLTRLKDLLDATPDVGTNRAASDVVSDLLALLGEAPLPERPAPGRGGPQPPVGVISSALWSRLAPPEALGFMAEIWSLLADAARELHPISAAELGAVRSNRLAGGAEPRLGWVEKTAAALGLPGVLLHLALDAAATPSDGAVLAVELPAPALVFGQRALGGDGPTVFWFTQALALLRQRATPLLRIAPEELQTMFLAAGVVAAGPGAEPTPELASALNAAPGRASAVAAQIKTLGKVLGRKERKALALQASRFGFEVVDARGWQRAVLRSADRFGLVIGGDVIAAVRALARLPATGPINASAATLSQNPAIIDLARFALGDDYLALRQEVGLARG